MHKMLKDIKNGSYAVVAEPDKDGNIKTVQLRYNETRHKFFLSEDKRGLIRRSITSKVALRMINNTIALTSSYGQTENK